VTLKELLARTVEARGNHVALRYKDKDHWTDVTYHHLLTRAQRVAEALAALGIERGDRVAIYRENAPDWVEIYFGIVACGAVAVPVDAKLTEQEVAYILRNSEARAVFLHAKQYSVLRQVEERVPNLEQVFVLEGREVLPVFSRNIVYHNYEDRLAAAAEPAASESRAYDRHRLEPDDLASLIYTSGTTGRQKGAMLTHGNFLANVQSCRQVAPIDPQDNFLLVLPLHHAFAFTCNLLLPVSAGAHISFVENLRTIGENMLDVSPSVLIGVPLLLEKMYERIMATLKQRRVAHALYNLHMRTFIVKSIAQRLGGRLRMVISGGAPCPIEVLEGFANLGIPIAEGYGLTETGPVLTLNPLDAPQPGTVGKPLPGVQIRVAHPNPQGVGEIAAKGANVMRGYFQAEEGTREAFENGWFMTGDLGHFDEDGYLVITGRKKSVIVNREGKNIYPEEVEAEVLKSPFISEALVLGYVNEQSGRGERVGIIVVPDSGALDEYAARKKLELTELRVTELLKQEIKRTTQELSEYKRPRRIRIRTEAFLKTATGKVKRYLYSLDAVEVE